MAAGTKTFQTQFRINAIWAGQPGVQKAQRALSGLSRTAGVARVKVQGLARGVAAGVGSIRLGERAIQGFTIALAKSFQAATEVQEAHDELGTTMERVAKRMKNTAGKSVAEVAAMVEESTQSLIAASEQMEKTGHDAETLQKGWAKLAATGALDPKQILENGTLSRTCFPTSTGQMLRRKKAAALGEQWADAIMRGNIAILKQMDLSTGEIELVKNVTKLEKEGSISGEEAIKRRQALVLKFAKKFEGETKRVFETPTGKIKQMWIQVGNVFENLGEPFIARAPEMAKAFTTIAENIKPAADELARITAEGLKGISEWFEENKEEIPKWFKFVEEGLGRVYNLLSSIGKLPVLFDLPKFIKDWMTPKPQGQLPGSPSKEPISGAAGTGGEAERRKIAGMNKARIGTQGGTGQFYSLGSAAAEAEQQARAAKAVPGPKVFGKGALAGKEQAFEAAAARHGVDPDYLMAIAKFESAGGTSNMAMTKRNISGHTLPGGKEYKTFATIDESIEALAANVARIQKKLGTKDIDAFAKEYAEIGAENDPNKTNAEWPGAVRKNLEQLKKARTGAGQAKMGGLNPDLVAKLETIQKQGKLKITSGHRSAEYNARVGGARGSQHIHGNAVDIDVSHMSQEERKALIYAASQAGITGIGVYKNSLHFDVGKRRAWGPSHGRESLPGWAEGVIQQHENAASLRSQTRGLGSGRQVAGVTNVNMNAPVTVNGVAPGREALMAKKTALAMRDPVDYFLHQMKEGKSQDIRTNFA